MAWNLVDFGKLGAAELNSWRQVREADPSLDSPFFHPAFAAAVHAVFGNVQVATNDHEDQLWFPVQVSKRVARPVGWPASDFQGPVAAPGVRVDPLELVRATGLRALPFDNIPEQRTEFAPWVEERHPSPFVDTTGGLDAYLSRVSKAGRDKMSQVRRRTNKAGRELGEVRLVWDAQDPDLLDRLIEIKRAQYAKTGVRDFFALPGQQELVHRAPEDQGGRLRRHTVRGLCGPRRCWPHISGCATAASYIGGSRCSSCRTLSWRRGGCCCES